MKSLNQKVKESIIETLKKLDKSTVIDKNWLEILWNDRTEKGMEILSAFSNIEGHGDLEIIFEKYEGSTIEEIINDLK